MSDREKIIFDYTTGEFIDFLKNDYDGKILKIFDDEGIDILNSYRFKNKKILSILIFSKYKNELLQNPKFIKVFLSTNVHNYIGYLNKLDFKTYDAILNECKENTKVSFLLSLFNENYILKLLDDFPYSYKLLYGLLSRNVSTKIINKIFTNYPIDLTKIDNIDWILKEFKTNFLLTNAKRNLEKENIELVHIPSNLITKEFKEKVWNNYDIFDIRSLINDMNYSANTDSLNEYVKRKEDKLINESIRLDLLPQYQKLYDSFKRDDLRAFDRMNLLDYFDNIFKEREESIYEKLKKLSDNQISSYIIDYHFEENFHNIMIDMDELLKFYFNGNIDLDETHVELYNRIRYIDYLSIEEKIELHNELKKYNLMEMFYDDMAFARRIVREAIKDYSLTRKDLEKYRDETLSKKYGVDVYYLNGELFFGIVKSGRSTGVYPGGHSFSLVGNGCVATFQSPKEGNTYLYDADDLNPDQIIHVFPADSFTYYSPYTSGNTATEKTNMLLMPDELLKESGGSYNELLILERGEKNTPIDSSIPELKRIAMFCRDNISPELALKAKKEKSPIILVNSSKYKKEPLINRKHYFLNSDYDYYQQRKDKKVELEKKRL